jgi:hypothetical protein
MKLIGKWIGIVLLNFFALIFGLVIMFMPLEGLLFLIMAVISGGIIIINAFDIGTQGFTELAFSFFHYGWKVYVGMMLFTMFVMTTFTFQHCCVGMNTFRGHIFHAGTRHLENLYISIFWPYMIYVTDKNLQKWCFSWFLAVINIFEYWWFIATENIQEESD